MSGGRRPTFALRTLGCKVNRVESDDLRARLLDLGCRESPESEAELIVVNTCTVTAEADSKVRKAIRHALVSAPEAAVLAVGCATATSGESLSSLSPRVVVESDKEMLLEKACVLLGVDAVRVPDSVVAAGEGFRSRVAVKIGDGCDNFCTYCIIAHARGPVRSTGLDALVAHVGALVDSGVGEVVLTGINLGRYRDPVHGRCLPELVRAVGATGIRRLRLSSIEPPDVTDELLGALIGTGIAAPHLHIPLQSGCDAVLSRMGRTYDTAYYSHVIDRTRAVFGDSVAITTDVIAGFPGETEAEFARTLEFVESMRFAKSHVFRYSRRKGTPAADMDGQVEPDVKARRAAALRAVGARCREDFIAQAGDRPLDVLVERVDRTAEGSVASGTSGEYLEVLFECAQDVRVGDLVRVADALHIA